MYEQVLRGEEMATLTIRLNDDLKAEASKVAEYYGLDLGSVTRAFYTQMVREHSIPLNFQSYEPNEESLRAIAEADDAIASGDYELYDDAASLLAAAGECA